ncbi:MAG: energy-coupling factor transporter transmembrane protein EcfT [Chloroflexota bacterium]
MAEPGPTRWHQLDSLTKLVLAVGTTMAAVMLEGALCLGVLAVAAVVLPAALARVLPSVLRMALLLALPLAVSAAIVNVLFSSGGTALAELGPLTITAEGVALATDVVVRVVAMAGAVVLFYLTTRPSELMASLQHRGVSPRLTFVIHNSVAMMPRLAERAGEVADAQRARGLDSEGSLLKRGRGVLAVATPTVLGAIHEVETRTLALETRGFTRPGPRTVLRTLRDSTAQRLGRWSIAVAVVVGALLRLAGVALPC